MRHAKGWTKLRTLWNQCPAVDCYGLMTMVCFYIGLQECGTSWHPAVSDFQISSSVAIFPFSLFSSFPPESVHSRHLLLHLPRRRRLPCGTHGLLIYAHLYRHTADMINPSWVGNYYFF